MAAYLQLIGFKHHGTKIFKSQTNFLYVRNTEKAEKIYLRCVIRSQCRATAVLHKETNVLEERSSHNHEHDAYTDRPDIMRKLRKAMSDNPSSLPRQVFNQVTRQDNNGGAVSFP